MRFFHVGNDTFDPNFNEINTLYEDTKYHTPFPKPLFNVSLWGSRIGGTSTWLDWDYEFVSNRSDIKKYFTFEIKGNILKITNKKEWCDFLDNNKFCERGETGPFTVFVDWAKVAKEYDAFYLTGTAFNQTRNIYYPILYAGTYAWDCGSIAVFNPACVKIVDPTKKEKIWIDNKINQSIS